MSAVLHDDLPDAPPAAWDPLGGRPVAPDVLAAAALGGALGGDVLTPVAGGHVERLVEAIRPWRCETVWSEPYNNRANWRAVAAGYEEGSSARAYLESMFAGRGARETWSDYALTLYVRVHTALAQYGAEQKHRYLVYQDGLTDGIRGALRGREGVLFQSTEGAPKSKTLPVVTP